MSGTIYSHHVTDLKKSEKCYLNTDEVQMLVAVLLHNNLINHHVHVLCPQTCQKIMGAYTWIGEDGHQENLRKAMHTIHEYLDCTQDILEHRYLAFLFNTGSYHWVTMVVVNPSCTMPNESFLSGTQGNSNKRVCGWFFFDSMGSQRKNKYDGGLKGTVGDTDIKIIGSVRFFLNVCASFITAINSPHQRGRNYDYEEHFGNHRDMKGSINFPRLDFDCPAIIKQVDGWNCGLACVANAVAFVHHFQNKEFLLSGIKPANDKRDEIRYIVDQDEYNLRSFWEDLKKTGSMKYKNEFTLLSILKKLRE